MKCQLQLVTTPTADTHGTCAILSFDNRRYMIGNIHEGLQRACGQQGTRLMKITDIFHTGKAEWKTIGGLMGMILTLADVVQGSAASQAEAARIKAASSGEKPVQLENASDKSPPFEVERSPLVIHGSSNILYAMATARRFIFRKGLPIKVNEISERSTEDFRPSWEDENLQVWALPVEPSSAYQDQLNIKSLKYEEKQAPKKRDLEKFLETSSHRQRSLEAKDYSNDLGKDEEEKKAVLRSVLHEMFDSEWRMDKLFTKKLSEVEMPAAIFIRDKETNKLERYDGPVPGGDKPLPEIDVLVRNPWPGALVADLPRIQSVQTATSYIFRTQPQRGKFDVKKADELGVEKGSKFTELTNGRSVLSKNGELVKPEQVLGDQRPGEGFAFVDIPTDEYTENILKRPEWSNSLVMQGIKVIIWNLGDGISGNEKLQKFIQQHQDKHHVISSLDHCRNRVSMDGAAADTTARNLIDPDRFPIQRHHNDFTPLPNGLSGCSIAERGLTVHVSPKMKVDKNKQTPLMNETEVLKKIPTAVSMLAAAAKDDLESRELKERIAAQELPSPDAEIITLGTGSALPSKHRNVSSSLLRVPGSGSYLLDCGENTLGQLSRIYTDRELHDVLCDLKMIWISHMHGDHHLGLTSVIKAWHTAIRNQKSKGQLPERGPLSGELPDRPRHIDGPGRLFIASEPQMIHWLREYAAIEDYGIEDLVLLEVQSARDGEPGSTGFIWGNTPVALNSGLSALDIAMRNASGLSALEAVNVPHCLGAKAVALTFPTGFKFSYSGDCRPSKSFVDIGQNSTVLLHEATFEDNLKVDAQAKHHCTTSEAIGVGLAMGARRVILTHFSQRYAKIPNMQNIGNKPLQLEEAPNQAEAAPAIEDDFAQTTQETSAQTSEETAELLQAGQLPEEPNKKVKIKELAPKVKLEDMKIAIAFDNMRVKVKDIILLEKYFPALQKLYGE